MGEPIEIIVRGVAHGRPRSRSRAFRLKTGKWVARNYHPKGGNSSAGRSWAKAVLCEQSILLASHGKMPATPWDGPVRVDWEAYFPRPARLNKKRSPEGAVWHTVKPDRDNVDKAILDALKKAGLYKDDCQVCDGRKLKCYVAKGCSPGIIIRATRLLDTCDEGIFA